jgi:flagellar hook-associated protein 1 FlgK
MSISSFYGLQTSLRGLIAQQRLLDTTGHNIANVSTDGYSRQKANLSASDPLAVTTTIGRGSLGSGVDVDSYTRVRDTFLDLQYRGQNANGSNWTATADALSRVEDALQEPSDNGLSHVLSEFWDTWSSLSNSPSEPAAKQAVVEQAGAVADALRSAYDQIALTKSQSLQSYTDLSAPASGSDPGGEVAQIAKQVATLNASIKRLSAAGDMPNDLLDARDALLDQLSGFGQISVSDAGDGSVNVAFVDTAVAGTTYAVVTDEAATWAGPPAGDAWSPGGKLGGLLEAGRDGGTLDGYLDTLDGIASQLVAKVNGAYGGDFFDPAGTTVSTLAVSSALELSPSSMVAGSGGAGSSDLAAAVAALRDDSEIDGAYASFVAKVGSKSREAQRQQANAQALVDTVDSRRQSVSGVSLDEEMTNLIQFQRGYQASSRAMSTIDEMLDVLINRTGRVGL